MECRRFTTDGQQPATGPKNATRLEHERGRAIEMVHRIDAKESLEGSCRPWEIFSAAANEKHGWYGRSRAQQHVRREVETRQRTGTAKLCKPMAGSAAYFGDVYAPRLTDKAPKRGLDAIVSVSFIALVVPGATTS